MKTGIVGSGFVGATAAYALVMRGVGRRVVLVDMNKARAAAEADDILHAVPFAHQLEVTSGEYSDLAECKVVVVSAGVGQKPGETRLELRATAHTLLVAAANREVDAKYVLLGSHPCVG